MISPHWKVYKAYLNRIPTPEIDSYGVKKIAHFVIIDFLGLKTANYQNLTFEHDLVILLEI